MSANQRGASAGGDVVGGDKTELHIHTQNHTSKPSKLEQLKLRLQYEVDAGHCSQDVIEELQRYHKKVPSDGVVGLEAKLEYAGRAAQKMNALEMKEQFAKLMEKWSLYASAQEIFVHLLAMADYKYSLQVSPLLSTLTPVDIDELIDRKIVTPCVEEVGIDVFSLDHKTAMGMIYWLAEQCRIRWHE